MNLKTAVLIIAGLTAFQVQADLDGTPEESQPPLIEEIRQRRQQEQDEQQTPKRKGFVLFAQRNARQQPQQAPQQAPPAPQYNEDAFEQLRNLSGRIDVVENQVSQLNAVNSGDKDSAGKLRKDLEVRFLAYEDALKKLETQIHALNDEVGKMREDLAKKSDKAEKAEPVAAAKNGKKNLAAAYEDGEALIGQKKWRDAILKYEDYRKDNPKGKFYADATYKIGVCMQEVGMKAEAKLFYEEVMAKFPGSKEAKKAAYRSKNLK